MKLEINPIELSKRQRELVAEFILKFNDPLGIFELDHLAEEQKKDLSKNKRGGKKLQEVIEDSPQELITASDVVEIDEDPNVVFNNPLPNVEINPKAVFAEIISKCTKLISSGKVKQEDVLKILTENNLPPLPALSTLFSEPAKLQLALDLVNGLVGK